MVEKERERAGTSGAGGNSMEHPALGPSTAAVPVASVSPQNPGVLLTCNPVASWG